MLSAEWNHSSLLCHMWRQSIMFFTQRPIPLWAHTAARIRKAAFPCCLASNKCSNPSTLGSAEFHLGWGQLRYFPDYSPMKVETLRIRSQQGLFHCVSAQILGQFCCSTPNINLINELDLCVNLQPGTWSLFFPLAFICSRQLESAGIEVCFPLSHCSIFSPYRKEKSQLFNVRCCS